MLTTAYLCVVVVPWPELFGAQASELMPPSWGLFSCLTLFELHSQFFQDCPLMGNRWCIIGAG